MALNPSNPNLVKFTILTIILQFISNGSAIKCFVCDSTDNPSCADLKTNNSIVAEECTLEKMRSINTWLFELNKFAYFDTGSNKNPLMTCQKVVARDPNTNRVVTARFCQLNTGETDACDILQSKLRPSADDAPSYGYGSNSNNNNNNNNGRRNGQTPAESDQEYHCSICSTDNCNGATSVRSIMTLIGGGGGGSLLIGLMIVVSLHQMVTHRLWW